MTTLRDRCVEMYAKMGVIHDVSADDLHAFVLAEIGRAADEKLAEGHALVLFFATREGCQEVFEAIQEVMPGLVERKWP